VDDPATNKQSVVNPSYGEMRPPPAVEKQKKVLLEPLNETKTDKKSPQLKVTSNIANGALAQAGGQVNLIEAG